MRPDKKLSDEMATLVHAAMSSSGPMIASSSVMHKEKPVEEPEPTTPIPSINIEPGEIKFPYKETDEVEITAQLAIDYYSALHLAGNKIVLEWNGGNDSGSVNLKINDEEVQVEWWNESALNLYNKIHAWVIDKMYDELDYGSWAGDFSAAGCAEFKIQDAFIGFEGTDLYSEDEHGSIDLNPHVVKYIPAEYFPEDADYVHVSVSGGYDGDDPRVYIGFRNSKVHKNYDKELTEDATKYLEAISNQISAIFGQLLNSVDGSNMYQDENFDIDDRTAPLEISFGTLEYYTAEETEKYVEINLLSWIEK